MNKQYLGDSYDAVKRLWQEIFVEWAPLYANPRFIPEDIRRAFTSFTRIPILSKDTPDCYSIFNDPDTGVRLSNRANQAESRSHITLSTIRDQLQNRAVRCVVTFDQSNHRESGLTPESQRNAKLKWLRQESAHAFYYVSHAPFLFAFSDAASMRAAKSLLRRAGVPESRLEGME